MELNPLLLIGLACVIAAIVGGGLKILEIEIPVLTSLRRQALLAGGQRASGHPSVGR